MSDGVGSVVMGEESEEDERCAEPGADLEMRAEVSKPCLVGRIEGSRARIFELERGLLQPGKRLQNHCRYHLRGLGARACIV